MHDCHFNGTLGRLSVRCSSAALSGGQAIVPEENLKESEAARSSDDDHSSGVGERPGAIHLSVVPEQPRNQGADEVRLNQRAVDILCPKKFVLPALPKKIEKNV